MVECVFFLLEEEDNDMASSVEQTMSNGTVILPQLLLILTLFVRTGIRW